MLGQVDTKSITVKLAKEKLNNLASLKNVELVWVQAHKGILGNEIADRAAKTGSRIKPSITINQSREIIKAEINDITYEA